MSRSTSAARARPVAQSISPSETRVRFLLDTCVLSDAAKPQQHARVHEWLGGQPSSALAISVITLGELRYGVERLSSGRKRTDLMSWLQGALPAHFHERILPVSDRVADAWAVLRATGEANGRPLPLVDGLLLATAQVHGLTFVTRNLRDAEHRGVSVLDPY